MMTKEMLTKERLQELLREFDPEIPTDDIDNDVVKDINIEITGGVDTLKSKWDGGGGAKDVAATIWQVLVEEDIVEEDGEDEWVEFFDRVHG